MDDREKQILKEAQDIKKRLREEECVRKTEEKKKRRLEKAEEKKRLQKKKATEEKKRAEAFKKKKELFETTFLPEFERDLKVINDEIAQYEKSLKEANNKKRKLRDDLEPVCTHKFGSEYSVYYGAYTYKDCEYCSYKECTREVSM